MMPCLGAAITEIYRYPVKGLSAETMNRVTLMPGECLPDATREDSGPCILRHENLSTRPTPRRRFQRGVLQYRPQRSWSALISKNRAYGCGRARHRHHQRFL